MGPLDLSLMLAHRRCFIRPISSSHPLSRGAIDRHASVLGWPQLSGNGRLPWDRSLIEAHAPRWDWVTLGLALTSLARGARSVELLRPLVELGPRYYEFARRFDQYLGDRARLQARVSAGERVDLSRVLEWPADAADWIPELIERAEEPVRTQLWEGLSGCDAFPWTSAFIDEHADALEWRRLSGNAGLPWSLELIRRHEDRWDSTELLCMLCSSEHDEHDEHLEAICDRVGDRVPWSWASFNAVWTAERFEHLRERVEDPAADEHTSAYWTFALEPGNWTPGFVDRLVALEAELGRATIDWRKLARRGGERLWTRAFFERYRDRLDLELLVQNRAIGVMLEPDIVDAFLGACVRPMLGLARNAGLEAAIAAAPDDRAGYEAYAEWLDERGDAQAEVIRAMCGVGRETVEPSAASRAAAAYASELGIEHALEWRHGFVRKAAWFRERDTGDWRLWLRLRPFAFVEELRILDGIHMGLGNFDRARIRDEDWEFLGSLPCLRKLALHQVSIEPTSKLRELVRITDLDLYGTFVFDLSVFAGMPALRSLVLHEELCALYWSGVDYYHLDDNIDEFRAFIDLAPLAEIPDLRHLGLRSYDVGGDLRPLRGCRSLETLELLRVRSGCERYDLYDLGVLDQLPQLRRLWVIATSDEELEALRARHPRLAINAGPRPWYAQPEELPGSGVGDWARLPDGYGEDE